MNFNLVHNFLTKNRKKNVSIIGFIENYPVKKVFWENETVLILGKSDYLWAYISSESKLELQRIIDEFQFETKYFASLESWMVSVVTKDRNIDWKIDTYRYILPEAIEIKPQTRKVKELNKTYADYIYNHSHYQKFTSIDYIRDRIDKDVAVGLFEDNKLVAWGLTHDDGALGFLHVIPEYRGNGYGKEIVRNLIKKKREIGKPVFANVEPQNNKPKKLLDSLGFEFDEEISWVKVV